MKTKLHNRNNKTYTDNICVKCKKEPETTVHPFKCSNTINKTLNQIKQILNEKISTRNKKKVNHQITKDINNTIDKWDNEITDMTIRGAITHDMIKIIKKYLTPTQLTECLYNYSNRFRLYLLTIWKERYKRFTSWEKENAITNARKRKKGQNVNTYTIQTSSTEIKDRYPSIVNEYMENYISNLARIEQIYTTSLNSNDFGSALAS